MKPHSRKLLYLPNDEDPPAFLQNPTTSAAAPPSASIGEALRPPITTAPFGTSVGLAVLVLLTALFFMGFFSLYIRRFAEGSEAAAASRRRRDPRGPSRPHAPPGRPSCSAALKGLDPAVIRSLPAFAYGGAGAKYQAECAVCLSDFEEEEALKAIPWCSHVFHAECIERWLCAHVTCPVCRDARLTEARSASGLGARSTAASSDTCLEIGEGGGGRGLGVRRSRSWSAFLGERGRPSEMERTMSF